MHETGNDINTIQQWVDWVIGQASIMDIDREKCKFAYENCANRSDLLRGDISTLWLEMGYTNAHFNYGLFT